MIVICPECETSYTVPPASVGEGRKVKCIRCTHIWWLALPEEEDVSAPPPNNAAAKGPEKGTSLDKHVPAKQGKFPTIAACATLLLLLLTASIAAIFYHKEVIQHVPVAEKFYRYLGLASTEYIMIEHALVDDLTQAGTQTMEVWLQGDIINHSLQARPLPKLQITLLEANEKVAATEIVSLRDIVLKPSESYSLNNKIVYEGRGIVGVELSLGNWFELWQRRHPALFQMFQTAQAVPTAQPRKTAHAP